MIDCISASAVSQSLKDAERTRAMSVQSNLHARRYARFSRPGKDRLIKLPKEGK